MVQFPGFTKAAAVVLADADVSFGFTQKALFIGVAGNLKVTTNLGDAVTFKGLAAGQILPVQVERVWTTGTTVTDVVALGD